MRVAAPMKKRLSLMKLIAVISGATTSAFARYISGGSIASGVRGGYPWKALTITLTGCLLIGLLWGLSERSGWSPAARSFVFIGILGSYATFSSFGLETLQLLREGPYRSLPCVSPCLEYTRHRPCVAGHVSG
ncbi:CrcB family protein [bacterium]|nr:MAG: CrcB family protein [bacterium]